MKTKKAVIFTLNFLNCGAVLQNCGLVNYLRETGIDAETLDLNTPYHQSLFHLFAPYSNSRIRQTIYNCFCILRYRSVKRKINRILKFRKDWLHLTQHAFESEDELLTAPPPADVYISGSDQVFRPEARFRRVYFQDFRISENQRKIAYAPSFGTDHISPETQSVLIPWLRDFSSLSAREESGADLLEQMTGERPPVVLDPVFLLEESFWDKLASKCLVQEKYIAVYDLNGGKALIEKARMVAKRLKLPIYVITANPQRVYSVKKQLFDCGPQEFLSIIRHAEFVLTDSFHGTAFSLIFRKPFITMIALPQSSARLSTLLKSLNQEKRLLRRDELIPEDVYKVPGKGMDIKLETMRNQSKEFLQNALIFGQ